MNNSNPQELPPPIIFTSGVYHPTTVIYANGKTKPKFGNTGEDDYEQELDSRSDNSQGRSYPQG